MSLYVCPVFVDGKTRQQLKISLRLVPEQILVSGRSLDDFRLLGADVPGDINAVPT